MLSIVRHGLTGIVSAGLTIAKRDRCMKVLLVIEMKSGIIPWSLFS